MLPYGGRTESFMDKKKYDVTIAGVDMSILSDEREEFVQRLVASLDADITAITSQNKRCSTLDAAILVALDASSERVKAEKRTRNLEAQIALYDANLRRMREENIKLKSALLGKQDTDFKLGTDEDEDEDDAAAADTAIESDADEVASQLTIDSPETAEETEPAVEAESVPEDKGDKLRQIESLLRGKNI